MKQHLKNYHLLLLLVLLLNSCDKEQKKNNTSDIDNSITEKINGIPQFSTNYNHEAMVLGMFHFNRAMDGSDVVAKNQIDITTKENQQLIDEIVTKIVEGYKPTIIAVESMPSSQKIIDSLYIDYKTSGKLLKHEAFQIGFRVAKQLNLPTVYAVDNRPPQPKSVMEMELEFDDFIKSLNQESIVNEYNDDNKAYNNYMDSLLGTSNVKEHLITLNSPKNIKRYKALSFTGLVNAGYKDNYVGADFTGKWYQRNTRIFVNVKNLTQTNNERVLIIYGAGHKWVLDEIFEGSPEFEVIQPFNYN